ncbi:MAG: hypothetical protein RIC95_06375 [Vicingaceae bacterium]
MEPAHYYSQDEIKLLQDKALIERKNRLLAHLGDQLAHLGEASKELYPELLTYSTNYKVSKGEQQDGLPFRLLDFPRYFTKEDVFAFRTLIWWGKYISCTLHLKGRFLIESKENIFRKLDQTEKGDLLCSLDGDEWEVDLLAANYEEFNSIDKAKVESANFIKLIRYTPLSNLNKLNTFHHNSLKQLLSFTPYAKH